MKRKGKAVEEKQETCPNCGYCPTCGRAQASWPVYPGTVPYPYPYARPWWGTITVGTGGATGGTTYPTNTTSAVQPGMTYSLSN